MDATELVLSSLERVGILARTIGEPAAYLPARPLENTLIADVLQAVRMADETDYLNPNGYRARGRSTRS